jgi:formylglycine-generating enzyme required for sulfatase activity
MDRLTLRQAIDRHFNDSELRDLCFELGIDYEHLEGNNKGDRVRALVLYAERHERLDELAGIVLRIRPSVGEDLAEIAQGSSFPSESGRALSDSDAKGLRPRQLARGWPSPRIVLAIALFVVIAVTLVSIGLRNNGLQRAASGPENQAADAGVDDPTPMSFVEAGSFLMGSTEGSTDHQPARMVYLDDFWIATYEVTNSNYQEFVDEANHRAPDHWPDGEFPVGLENHPVVGVTWHDAQQYCEWDDGKRLPTEAEWEKAARGTDERRWPWGNTNTDGYANTLESGVGQTAPVGSYSADLSPYGVRDLAGNVQEWVNDWYHADYYAVAVTHNPPGPISGETKVVRGGAFWLDFEQAMTYARLGIYPPEFPPPVNEEITTPSSTIGFRCACIGCE